MGCMIGLNTHKVMSNILLSNDFSLIFLIFHNFHEYANGIIFILDHWLKELSSCITHDIITRNIDRFGLKLLNLWIILYDFQEFCNIL